MCRRSNNVGSRRTALRLGVRVWSLVLLATVALVACSKASRQTGPVSPSIQKEAPVPNRAILAEPEIRVAVARAAGAVQIQAGARPARLADRDGRDLGELPADQLLRVRAAEGGLVIELAGRELSDGACLDVRATEGLLRVNGQELAPRVTLILAGNAMTVIARLNLEEYLAGVLAGEVPYERWAAEALKAQAVTSRSYALFQMKTHAGDIFDVEANESSQVFKPGLRNHPILTGAVSATRGQAVTCQGRLFPAYFHSTCGGATCPAERVFTDQPPVATLGGVSCPFCRISPAYQWTARLNKEALRQRLAAAPELAAARLGAVQTIEAVAGEKMSGRAETVRVTHAGGVAALPANRFRLVVGSHELKSVLWDRVTDLGDAFEIQGRGFGHGVGLCQYGSQGMGLQNYTYEQILGFYFPGGELTTLYGGAVTAGR